MKTFSAPDGRGVFPNQWIDKAREAGVIASRFTIDPKQVQPASLDLRLGEVAYRLQSSFLPNGRTVRERLEDLTLGRPLALDDEGVVLERNQPYLIELMEHLSLPPGVRAATNPKSSTGRLDVFTRVICDGGYHFDQVPPEYEGPLYLEVVSRSFTISVSRGLSLNQLRLMTDSHLASEEELRRAHELHPLLYDGAGRPLHQDALRIRDGLFLSLALDATPAGYRARRNSELLDLGRTDYYSPPDFWEEVSPHRGGIVLEPDDFYLLMSAESVSVPPHFAAEMQAYDPTSGELRTHYAGFFDPGFGYEVGGSRAALEVRAHDVPFLVEQGQFVCKLSFERMLETPTLLYGGHIGSNYQRQERALSKHFRFNRPDSSHQLTLPVP